MSPETVIELGRALLKTALLLAAPLLGIALLVGLFVSLLQAATGLQEQTLSFVPKALAVGGLFLLLLPWFLKVAAGFTASLVGRAAQGGG
jgi:flagellar biosynthetic protein FliQ